MLAYAELLHAGDQREAALAFFRTRLAALHGEQAPADLVETSRGPPPGQPQPPHGADRRLHLALGLSGLVRRRLRLLMADERDEVTPAGEPIHLPNPSFLPVLVAAGLTITLVGVVLNWVVCGLGVAITVVCIVRWVGQTREEMAELPLDHR